MTITLSSQLSKALLHFCRAFPIGENENLRAGLSSIVEADGSDKAETFTFPIQLVGDVEMYIRSKSGGKDLELLLAYFVKEVKPQVDQLIKQRDAALASSQPEVKSEEQKA